LAKVYGNGKNQYFPEKTGKKPIKTGLSYYKNDKMKRKSFYRYSNL